MRIKLFTRLITLALVFMMTLSIPALADSCALCGKETGSEAYLCAACLLDMLAEKDISGGMEITGMEVGEDGRVTLTWQDAANNGPYTVYYELLESAPVPFGWTAAEDVAETTLTLPQLAPGVSYVFIVADASGNQVEQVYYAAQPEDGNEIGARIRFKTMRRHDRTSKQTTWSAAEIAEDNDYRHGLYLRLTYSPLKKTRYYAFCVAVEAPNGFADVIFSGDLELSHGKSQVPVWGFVGMDDYFSYLERYYGGVPTGEYTVTMYFDGGYVDSETFTVKE